MFLALKEIQYSKFRYFLVISLMFLIAFLVFFLTGLAFGLGSANRSAVDQWEADFIVLEDGVENRIQMSLFEEDLIDELSADQKAPLAVQMTFFENDKADESMGSQLIGIEGDSFLSPEIKEGRLFEGGQEAVIDQSLLEEYDLAIGDTLTFNNADESLEIVGVTENAQLSVQPVVYMDLDGFQGLELTPSSEEKPLISAVVTRGETEVENDSLEVSAISDFIADLPGYAAQWLTFSLMIIFLIVIAAVVIGIFIYVLTLQKESIFGVMKAQGISNAYIMSSVLSQTLILALVGVVTGGLVTFLTSLVLPATVPFMINWPIMLIIGGLIVVFALLGGLASTRTVTKIDPLDAI